MLEHGDACGCELNGFDVFWPEPLFHVGPSVPMMPLLRQQASGNP